MHRFVLIATKVKSNDYINQFLFLFQIKIGDEIDLIKDISAQNPDHIIVARIEILSAKPSDDENIAVAMRRFKTLTIENYRKENVWKSSQPPKAT